MQAIDKLFELNVGEFVALPQVSIQTTLQLHRLGVLLSERHFVSFIIAGCRIIDKAYLLVVGDQSR